MPSCIASSFFNRIALHVVLRKRHRRNRAQNRNAATAKKTAFHPRTMNRFVLQIVAVPQGTFVLTWSPIHQKRNHESSWIVGAVRIRRKNEALY